MYVTYKFLTIGPEEIHPITRPLNLPVLSMSFRVPLLSSCLNISKMQSP